MVAKGLPQAVAGNVALRAHGGSGLVDDAPRLGAGNRLTAVPAGEEEIRHAFEDMLRKHGEADSSYSEMRWREMVDSAVVNGDRSITFLLTSGEEIVIAL